MEGTKNINKKLLITIFTFLFLIRFIFSVYPQATSPQNNAASSLESNSIIQWIINSSVSGYSTAGQYLANFLSINGVPSDVWTIIVFLMTTLFFIGIYTFIFEIFVKKIGSNEETTTMKKAKILFIFSLSLFSAISIGYAIPFLFSLYGFVLLIVLLIVLFFFGRAIVSYGKIFHHSVDLFAAQVKKSLIEAENAAKDLPEAEAKPIIEGIEKIRGIYDQAKNASEDAEKKFKDALSTIKKEHEEFINSLNNLLDYYNYLPRDKHNELESFINQSKNKIDTNKKELEKILRDQQPDIQQIQSIRKLTDEILSEIHQKLGLDDKDQKVQQILKNANNILSKTSEINDAIKKYREAENKLGELHSYEEALNGDIVLKIRKPLGVYGNRKKELAMLSALDNSREGIERMEKSVNATINLLEQLLRRLFN